MENKYHYSTEKEYNKKIKTSEYSRLCYYSKKEMKKKYPKKEYTILGGIGDSLKNELGTFLYKNEEKKYYTLYYSKLVFGVDGYVSLGNDQYLAVVKRFALRNFLRALLLLVLIVGVGVTSWFFLKDGDIDPLAKDYTPPVGMNVNTDPSRIALPGYDQIRMRAGTDTAYVALWNPPENPCYFQFTIIKEDNDQVLYESGMIPPGKAITEVKLSESFEEGIYKVKIKIDTFDINNKKNQLNGGTIESKIVAIK